MTRGYSLEPFSPGPFTVERPYWFMWITHYDVSEFLHVSQLYLVALDLCYVVFELRDVVLQVRYLWFHYVMWFWNHITWF